MRARFDGEGQVIVVTGGANGIGRALVLAASAAGAIAVACDADQAGLDALRAEDGRVAIRRLDVSDRAAVQETLGAVEAEHRRIDGLVCAAAIQPRVSVHDTSPDVWQRVLDVNLNGVVWCYQAVVPGMMARRGGAIVAFSSGLAGQGWPGASAYAATKAALVAFVKSAAKEVAPHRVRVNLISPGVIDTPQYRAANAGADHERWRASTGVGEPADVVGPLLFLLSDAATMTASILSRDFVYPARDPAEG